LGEHPSSLTFGELQTLLVEIEATLNNRPIPYVYDDENRISYPLIPSRLIYGRQLVMSNNSSHFEINSTYNTLTRRAKHHAWMLSNFAKQWSREYLLSLREHYQKGNPARNNYKILSKDDLVLLKDEGIARCLWKIAKVLELIPSRDGMVRAARVQVLSTDKRFVTLRRPIQHLIPLEVCPECNGTQ